MERLHKRHRHRADARRPVVHQTHVGNQPEAMIAAHRPWVSVRAEIVSPITFMNGGVSIKIRFICKNIGGSPAINHVLFAEIFPSQLHAIDNIKGITDFARGMCTRVLDIGLPISNGIVLLPGGILRSRDRLALMQGISPLFSPAMICAGKARSSPQRLPDVPLICPPSTKASTKPDLFSRFAR